MISEQKIRELVQETIDENICFIVDVKVMPNNKINVSIDNDNGVSIGDCASVSRYIESKLNRDEEDFELEVSSPGLDQPFKIMRQYLKYLNKQVQVLTKEGIKYTGKLLTVDAAEIEIEEVSKEKISGKKGKQVVIKNHPIAFNNIKETKVVVFFN